jgi:hypothetical protein
MSVSRKKIFSRHAKFVGHDHDFAENKGCKIDQRLLRRRPERIHPRQRGDHRGQRKRLLCCCLSALATIFIPTICPLL